MTLRSLSVASTFLFLMILSDFSISVHAAGFEKSVMWSGKAAGQAGAVVSTIEGAEALYFNPAGLAGGSAATEISGNFSPTLSQFKGANAGKNGIIDEGKNQFSPIFGVTGSHKITNNLGVGAGLYVSGGTKAKFESLDYTSVGAEILRPTVSTDLRILEAALGAGYEVLPGLRIGAAWRLVMVDADFSLARVVPGVLLLNASANDVSATRWNAYKVGAQYTSPDHSWGIGAQFRSQVNFIAKGTASGTAELPLTGAGTQATATGGPVHVSNTFPMQLVLGAFYKVTSNFRISPEFSFTQYSKNKVLDLSGSLSIPTIGSSALSDLSQEWKNQQVYRLGAEYDADGGFVYRAGYVMTSQVTPSDRARSSFASPGTGHAVALGLGRSFRDFDLDGAVEYSFAKGTGTNPVTTDDLTTPVEFSSAAYALHLGATYRF